MLMHEPDKYKIEHTEGWVGAGHLTTKLNKAKILKGITVVVAELIKVGLFAQDKTVGTSVILTANWRGSWWLKLNPKWGLVVEDKPKPGPDGKRPRREEKVEEPNAAEAAQPLEPQGDGLWTNYTGVAACPAEVRPPQNQQAEWWVKPRKKIEGTPWGKQWQQQWGL